MLGLRIYSSYLIFLIIIFIIDIRFMTGVDDQALSGSCGML